MGRVGRPGGRGLSAGDDILARLDAIAERRVKCPTCGRSDELYIIWPEFTSRAAAANLTGQVIVSDRDNDYITLTPDIAAALGIVLPKGVMLMCGNFNFHPHVEGVASWAYFTVATEEVFDANLFEDIRESDLNEGVTA